MPTAVIDSLEQRGSSSKQTVEVAIHRIVDRLHIGNPAIVIDPQIRHMARIAADLIEDRSFMFRGRILLA